MSVDGRMEIRDVERHRSRILCRLQDRHRPPQGLMPQLGIDLHRIAITEPANGRANPSGGHLHLDGRPEGGGMADLARLFKGIGEAQESCFLIRTGKQ